VDVCNNSYQWLSFIRGLKKFLYIFANGRFSQKFSPGIAKAVAILQRILARCAKIFESGPMKKMERGSTIFIGSVSKLKNHK
jgi:3-deoxy-D-manno-octulosonic-acid transferase